MFTSPPPVSRAWRTAIREHQQVVDEFGRTLTLFTDATLQRRLAPGRWSAAELTVHVCQSYDLGAVAAHGGASMQLLSPRPLAFLSRNLVLPILFATRSFPSEAPAPREVRPDIERAAKMSVSEAIERFTASATTTLEALQRPDAAPVTHAYFGTMSPRVTLRLLSAHTRHHTSGLRMRLGTAS